MMLVDTDVFIDYLRRHPPAVEFFQNLVSNDDVFFSSLTEVELVSGQINTDPVIREKMLHFIHCWQDYPPDHLIAVQAGDLRRDLDLSLADAVIAATALHLKADLVTRNVVDFKKVPGLKIKVPY